jgi:hypothetical protein
VINLNGEVIGVAYDFPVYAAFLPSNSVCRLLSFYKSNGYGFLSLIFTRCTVTCTQRHIHTNVLFFFETINVPTINMLIE